MPRNIKITEIVKYSQDQYERLLRSAVLETDLRLKNGSPVASGRLRVSWQIGENSAPGVPKPPGDYGGKVPPPERVNYKTEKAGNVYSIHNNLPYVEPVLMGNNMPPSWNNRWRSKDDQIQRGYPLVVAKDIQTWIQIEAARIARSS
jgi:hypothetical protein